MSGARRTCAAASLLAIGLLTAAPTPPPPAAVPRLPNATAASPLPPSCARPVVRPLHKGGGWHRVQYDLEEVYCGAQPGRLYAAILAPGARSVSENHYAGALFADLYVRGEAGPALGWLRAQLEGDFQGGEQGGGYTNYYRADVLAGLRWAVEHGESTLAELARRWLARSYALDLLHTVPGGFEVVVPCARMKLYNRDGREMSLALLAGEADPLAVLAARRWQYPAYDDVRWLADALLARRLRVDPDAAAWARRRDRAALTRILADLDGLRLRSPLRWVLLDSGGWYSFAPEGIGDSPSRQVDAVAATARGEVSELLRERGRRRAPVRVEGARLVSALAPSEGVLPLPPGKPVLTVDIGLAPAAARR